MHPPADGRGPDRDASLAQYRQRAPVYDTEVALFEPVRREAIQRLRLQPGDHVLDVGCGTGLSFQALLAAVGPQGRVVGIEQSPEMLDKARQRVRQRGWRNVELVNAPAAVARLRGRADAALFLFTHDILREPEAVAHVMRHLKPGARVAAAGLQWAPPWAWLTNSFVLMAALYSVTSLEGLDRPWSVLGRHLDPVDVNGSALGGVYVASGVVAPAGQPR